MLNNNINKYFEINISSKYFLLGLQKCIEKLNNNPIKKYDIFGFITRNYLYKKIKMSYKNKQ